MQVPWEAKPLGALFRTFVAPSAGYFPQADQ